MACCLGCWFGLLWVCCLCCLVILYLLVCVLGYVMILVGRVLNVLFVWGCLGFPDLIVCLGVLLACDCVLIGSRVGGFIWCLIVVLCV